MYPSIAVEKTANPPPPRMADRGPPPAWKARMPPAMNPPIAEFHRSFFARY